MADEKKKKDKKSWFKGFKAELKKVTWQTPKQLAKNTAAVITLVLIVAIIVFVLDMVFNVLNEHGVEKLKEFVQSTETVKVEDNTILENDISNEVVVDNEVTSENTASADTAIQENANSTLETEENNIVEE